jgi:hypothetical protein
MLEIEPVTTQIYFKHRRGPDWQFFELVSGPPAQRAKTVATGLKNGKKSVPGLQWFLDIVVDGSNVSCGSNSRNPVRKSPQRHTSRPRSFADCL